MMTLRPSASLVLAISFLAVCSCGGHGKKPSTSGASGRDGGLAGTGAAGTGAAGTGSAGTGNASAGTGGPIDAAVETGTNVTNDGGGDASDAPSEIVLTAPNYQLTGTWPKLKAAFATKAGKLAYTKVTIHDTFLAESCAIGDYNKDGKPDISSGRRWYEGPTFKTAHIFRGGHEVLPALGATEEIDTGVSDDQADFAFDIDGDGWADIINISNVDVRDDKNPAPAPAPQSRATAYWYKNPGPALAGDPMWVKTSIHNDVRLEQHGIGDVDGDGKPEILGACQFCTPRETKGYYQGDWTKPGAEWTYHSVTVRYTFPFDGLGKLHGIGLGDIDGDGKADLLERGGVWKQQGNGTWNATVCPDPGCGWIRTSLYNDTSLGDNLGPSHMYAADFDGDGDADIFSADWAHGWGLSWYEQKPGLAFVRHQIMGTNSEADLAKYGPVVFSEPHALQVVDMDGDGIPDVVTGKMHFAQPLSYGDPDPNGTPYVYVFKTIRKPSPNGGPVTFEPHMVDDKVGVGANIGVGHANTDGIVDFCVATKLGLHVFLGQ